MQVRDPSLALDFHLDARDAAVLDPFAGQQVEGPLLVGPAPAARREHVFEERRAARSIARDAGGGQGRVGRRAEDEALVLAVLVVQSAVLQFEDFDFARFGAGCQFDVGFGEREEERATFVLGVAEQFLVFGRREEVLDGWVAEGGQGVADEKEDEAPGEKVGGYEEHAGEEEK